MAKYNNLIEQTYKLEEQTELQEEKIKVAKRRIEEAGTYAQQRAV